MSKKENPRQSKAVALRYNNQDNIAPIIVASGYGEVAKRIIEVADQNAIPIYRDDSTASLLAMLEVGSGVPPELYEVVAVIYGQIMKASGEIKKANTAKNKPPEQAPPSLAEQMRILGSDEGNF